MNENASNENQADLNNTYKVTLAGPGMDFQREIPESTAQKVIAIIMTGPKNEKTIDEKKYSSPGPSLNESFKDLLEDIADGISSLTSHRGRKRLHRRAGRHFHRMDREDVGGQEFDEAQVLSIREYLMEVRAERNPDAIVAIAAFLQEHLGWDRFSTADLKSQFKNAGLKVPRNLSRDIKWTEAIGWISPDPNEPGYYNLTDEGKMALEENFSEDIKKATKQKYSQPDAETETETNGRETKVEE